MKRTIKLLTAMFLFAAFLFVQDAQAQSFSANDAVSELSEKSGVNESNFYGADDARSILKAEATALRNAAGNLNGGAIEAENSLRMEFYHNVGKATRTADSVMEAIQVSVPGLIQHASQMNVAVNTQAIIDDAIALLLL